MSNDSHTTEVVIAGPRMSLAMAYAERDRLLETVQDIYDLSILDGGDFARRLIALIKERHPEVEDRYELKKRQP